MQINRIVRARVWNRNEGRHVFVMIDLDFDLDAIAADLAVKAMANKSGRTKLLSGAIIGTIRKQQP